MDFILERLQEYEAVLASLGILSLFFFAASLVILPFVISRLPDNYFLNEYRLRRVDKKPATILETILVALKNILGVICILAGIVMLVLPGQGLMTILIGFSLTNFPGKYALELKLMRNPAIFKSLNWIRHKAGKNSLQLPS